MLSTVKNLFGEFMNAMIKKLLQGQAVEWKSLGEVGELVRGNGLTKKDLSDDGVPAIHYGQIYTHFGTFATQTKSFVSTALAKKLKKAQNGDVLLAGTSENLKDVMKPLGWLGGEIAISGDMFAFRPNKQQLDTKYLTYLLQAHEFQKYKEKHAHGTKVTRLKSEKFLSFIIPIPPLSVQSHIVQILDTFTELTAELTAELSMRQKQYQYYRDFLLSEHELAKVGFEWKSLGEVGEVRMCKRILKSQTSDTGDIPFYKIGTFGKEPNAFISRELFEKYREKYNYPKMGEILISASGTIGRTVIFNGEDAYFQDSNIVWIENDEKQVLNKFLFYLYQIADWNIAEGGTIKRLYNDNLKKLQIPIPPLSVQNQIVAILDTFDTLTQSISEGLPKEIQLRQKQYEYYREQLLNFTATI